MKKTGRLAWLKIDRFTLMLLGTLLLASFLPARGSLVPAVDLLGKVLVIALFFIHGARLPREAVVGAIGQWKLQLLILAATFALFPLIGIALKPLSGPVIEPMLFTGILFLCCLPSTVQSSIALTSIARGNVPAAVCAAAASNLAGVVFTPLLTGLLLASSAAINMDAVWAIVGLILIPFSIGQALHGWIGAWLLRHKMLTSFVDRGAILVMVYGAFGKAVTGGLWQAISGIDIAILLGFCLLILAVVVIVLRLAARLTGLARPDEASLVFCGSVKSLATGVPMANVLFPAAMAGAVVLPVMMFHIVQLVTGAFLARVYERRAIAAAPNES
ncbi:MULTISPECIES: bile acid:sodium symporter family protein [unclassified Sphingobium]|uniref:bile acid:sodium symporter family protein n=1 Tax=unclassified Sphingobium TaxID=2611147 RepID=UPI002224A9E1|nr:MULTISPECIES: bile acid:sodium symporter family protein [unclassified Sphingobium]MCW2391117.1 sodium/bile acid cotransporter 7 [Sphingobium sp. B11D3A]MCW2411853.1 sodium/bile acid cotransporter 7 [Sphingobium sp. B8D3D]MCW2415849.1 sodium/bile acid cotransporter 7 [Sphingobium sp. B8D3A]